MKKIPKEELLSLESGAAIIVKFSELPLNIEIHAALILSFEQFGGVCGFSMTLFVKCKFLNMKKNRNNAIKRTANTMRIFLLNVFLLVL